MTQSVILKFNNHHHKIAFQISVSVEHIMDNYECSVFLNLNSECPI